MKSGPTIGEAAKARRKALGLTQEQVADRTGDVLNQAYISRLETGTTEEPSARAARTLARALETTVEELLSGQIDAAPKPLATVPASAVTVEGLRQTMLEQSRRIEEMEGRFDALAAEVQKLQGRGVSPAAPKRRRAK